MADGGWEIRDRIGYRPSVFRCVAFAFAFPLVLAFFVSCPLSTRVRGLGSSDLGLRTHVGAWCMVHGAWCLCVRGAGAGADWRFFSFIGRESPRSLCLDALAGWLVRAAPPVIPVRRFARHYSWMRLGLRPRPHPRLRPRQGFRPRPRPRSAGPEQAIDILFRPFFTPVPRVPCSVFSALLLFLPLPVSLHAPIHASIYASIHALPDPTRPLSILYDPAELASRRPPRLAPPPPPHPSINTSTHTYAHIYTYISSDTRIIRLLIGFVLGLLFLCYLVLALLPAPLLARWPQFIPALPCPALFFLTGCVDGFWDGLGGVGWRLAFGGLHAVYSPCVSALRLLLVFSLLVESLVFLFSLSFFCFFFFLFSTTFDSILTRSWSPYSQSPVPCSKFPVPVSPVPQTCYPAPISRSRSPLGLLPHIPRLPQPTPAYPTARQTDSRLV